jgi:hypothetical protein
MTQLDELLELAKEINAETGGDFSAVEFLLVLKYLCKV